MIFNLQKYKFSITKTKIAGKNHPPYYYLLSFNYQPLSYNLSIAIEIISLSNLHVDERADFYFAVFH